MAKFIVGSDQYADEMVEARTIDAAVKLVADRDGDQFGDRFDVWARSEDADVWSIFPCNVRTEVIVTVGRCQKGPAVKAADDE